MHLDAFYSISFFSVATFSIGGEKKQKQMNWPNNVRKYYLLNCIEPIKPSIILRNV